MANSRQRRRAERKLGKTPEERFWARVVECIAYIKTGGFQVPHRGQSDVWATATAFVPYLYPKEVHTLWEVEP